VAEKVRYRYLSLAKRFEIAGMGSPIKGKRGVWPKKSPQDPWRGKRKHPTLAKGEEGRLKRDFLPFK